jgi:hypothetical protein
MANARRERWFFLLLLLLLLGTSLFFLLSVTDAPPPLTTGALPAPELPLADESQPAPDTPQAQATEDEAPPHKPQEPAPETPPAETPEPEAQSGYRATVAGRVVNYDGESFAGADVHVQYSFFARGEFQSGQAFEFAHNKVIRADARGIYEFEIVNARSDPGLFAIVSHHATPAGKKATDAMGDSVNFGLRNGEHRGGIRLEVLLGPLMDADAMEMDFAARVSGRVVDQTGHPVAGATVRISYQFRVSMDAIGGSLTPGDDVQTDSAGAFTLTIAGRAFDPPATALVALHAAADGFAASDLLPVRNVKHGEHREGIVIELAAAGAAAGRILDAEHNPAARAYVSARWLDDGQVQGAFTRADENGRFVLKGLRAGKWQLQVTQYEPYMWLFALDTFTVIAGIETQLPDAVLTPPQPPAPPTTARARLMLDGEPLQRGPVELRVGSRGRYTSFSGRLGEDGEVTFSGLTPGEWQARLIVAGRDIEPYTLTLILQEGRQDDLGELHLRWAAQKAD